MAMESGFFTLNFLNGVKQHFPEATPLKAIRSDGEYTMNY